MGKVVTIAAVVVAIAATGISLSLYASIHPSWWHAVPAQVVAPPKSPKQDAKPDPVAVRERMKAFEAKIARDNAASTDKALTGDPNGHAEWSAPDDDTSPTLCGVTPVGRYFIKRNELGQTRYDENTRDISMDFQFGWNNAQCDETAPVNQSRLLARKYEEDTYNRSHPINSDCLMAQIHQNVTNDKAAMERSAKDPHYCQNGDYERDQAAKSKDAILPDVPAMKN